MEILIDSKPAVLKKGTSFQMVAENRLFTGSDTYTLNITFPLRGCKENIDIFGHIGRVDVKKEKVKFDCIIRDNTFERSGIITITEITPKEVKTQFLEGKCVQNFDDSFDDTYINELELGEPDTTMYSPKSMWSGSWDYYALPWVNDESGNIQNKADLNSNGEFEWHSDTTSVGLSFQPMLLFLTKKICTTIGYTYDFSWWESSPFKHLIMCNVLPAAWDNRRWASALPHWTVTEYFEELEKLMNCQFDFDHNSKKISCNGNEYLSQAAGEVVLDTVVDEYTAAVSSEDDQCKYNGSSNLKYASQSHRLYGFHDCNWFFDKYGTRTVRTSVRSDNGENRRPTYETVITRESNIRHYDSIDDLMNALNSQINYCSKTSTSFPEGIFYCSDYDRYFVLLTLNYSGYWEASENGRHTMVTNYRYWIFPINQYGARIVDEDSENETELKIIPARYDWCDDQYGDLMFMAPGSFAGTDNSDNLWQVDGRGGRCYIQRTESYALLKGEPETGHEYYSNIYVGFYDGMHRAWTNSYLPRPYFDLVDVRADGTYHESTDHTLALNDRSTASYHFEKYELDTKKKYQFSFLSDSVPDPKSIFHIKGRRFLCEKLTLTFTPNGKSQLIKGTFYEITAENSQRQM